MVVVRRQRVNISVGVRSVACAVSLGLNNRSIHKSLLATAKGNVLSFASYDDIPFALSPDGGLPTLESGAKFTNDAQQRPDPTVTATGPNMTANISFVPHARLVQVCTSAQNTRTPPRG